MSDPIDVPEGFDLQGCANEFVQKKEAEAIAKTICVLLKGMVGKLTKTNATSPAHARGMTDMLEEAFKTGWKCGRMFERKIGCLSQEEE